MTEDKLLQIIQNAGYPEAFVLEGNTGNFITVQTEKWCYGGHCLQVYYDRQRKDFDVIELMPCGDFAGFFDRSFKTPLQALQAGRELMQETINLNDKKEK